MNGLRPQPLVRRPACRTTYAVQKRQRAQHFSQIKRRKIWWRVRWAARHILLKAHAPTPVNESRYHHLARLRELTRRQAEITSALTARQTGSHARHIASAVRTTIQETDTVNGTARRKYVSVHAKHAIVFRDARRTYALVDPGHDQIWFDPMAVQTDLDALRPATVDRSYRQRRDGPDQLRGKPANSGKRISLRGEARPSGRHACSSQYHPWPTQPVGLCNAMQQRRERLSAMRCDAKKKRGRHCTSPANGSPGWSSGMPLNFASKGLRTGGASFQI